jgi:single-strand DNA-binding protein
MPINRVTIVGNLTRDPELRGLPSGGSVCSLRVAVNERRKDASGQWSDAPNFFNVTIFGNSADNAARFLSKGRQVAVDGRLRWREYQDREGNKREAIEIVAQEVQFIGGRESGSQGGGDGGGYQAPQSQGGYQAPQGGQGGYQAPQTQQAPPPAQGYPNDPPQGAQAQPPYQGGQAQPPHQGAAAHPAWSDTSGWAGGGGQPQTAPQTQQRQPPPPADDDIPF